MSLQVFEIPLMNVPQTFEITLGSVDLYLTCKWNDSQDAGWVLDFADQNQNPILCNVPLITGVDLLNGLNYVGIPGTLYVFTDGDFFAVPTLDNLGTNAHLYYQIEVDSVS